MLKKVAYLVVFAALIVGIYSIATSGTQSSETSVAAQAVNTDWPQLQHDAQNSGYQPNMDIPTNKRRSAGGYGNPTWQYTVGEETESQPVTSLGIVVITTISGKVVALRLTDGGVVWTVDTGASILGTAAIADNKVIVANYEGKVIALNATNGSTAWTNAQAKGAYSNSPKVSGSLIYIGSEEGTFYAINLSTGATTWSFKVGGSTDSGSAITPIYTTAAVLSGKVFFGAENMQVYALDAATGGLIWKHKVSGQSFNHRPIVVSSQNGGVVMARTQPIYSFHSQLSSDQNAITAATGKSWQGNPLGALADWIIEQKAISDRLANNPSRRTLWELDLNTGNEKFSTPLPILFTYGHGDAPDAPVVDDVNNRAWVFGRTIYARFDSGSTVIQYADVLKLNLSFNPSVYSNSALGQAALGFNYFPCNGTQDCQIEQEEIHKVSDEPVNLSATRNALLVSTWVGYGGLDLTTGSTFNIRYYGSDDTTDALPRGESIAIVGGGYVIIRDSVGVKAYKVN